MKTQSSMYEPPDDPEVLEFWSMTPAQRFEESQKLWAVFLALGGSLEPEPDWQSPFYDEDSARAVSADGGPGVHRVRRRRVQPGHRSGGSGRSKKRRTNNRGTS
jgi:hypothetical protein